MKGIIFYLTLFLCSTFLFADSTYRVVKIYQIVPIDSESIAIDDYGNEIEISQLLVPSKLNPGTYEIRLTRKANNLYRIDGYDFFLKTSLCLELALGQKAILEIDGYSSKITFVKGF